MYIAMVYAFIMLKIVVNRSDHVHPSGCIDYHKKMSHIGNPLDIHSYRAAMFKTILCTML